MYTYIAYKVLIPVVLVMLFLIYRKNILKNKINFFKFGFTTLLAALPLLILHLQTPAAGGRFLSTSLLGKGNLYVQFIQILARYFSYLSTVNLFVRNSPEPTQQIPGFGAFYQLEFIFLLIGSFVVLKDYPKYRKFVLLASILTFPAILTWNWFYPARVLPFFSFLTIIIAVGIFTTFRHLRKSKIGILVGISCLALFFLNFGKLLTTKYLYEPYTQRGNWQYGMKDIIQKIKSLEGNYDHVVFETRTAQPHIFMLFYLQYDPAQYQQDLANQGGVPIPRKNFNFGKYEFRDVYWPQDKYLRNTLFVSPPSSLPLDKVRENIHLKDVDIIYDEEGNNSIHFVGVK